MNIYNHNDLFIRNKYYTWYYNIIENALSQKRNKIKSNNYELHHILPKSLFPTYKNLSKNKWNGVLLTFKEHFICHLLLVRMTTNKYDKIKMQKSITAFILNKNTNTRKITSKQFETIKLYDRLCKVGIPRNIETINKISNSMKFLWENNKEYRLNLTQKLLNRNKDPIFLSKLSEAAILSHKNPNRKKKIKKETKSKIYKDIKIINKNNNKIKIIKQNQFCAYKALGYEKVGSPLGN